MIKLLVVAGDTTESLVKYLDNRGSLSIDKSYNTLSMGYKDIKDSLIKVDKLVYVMQGTNVNLVTEMSILKNLLQDSAFFKVHEIILFVKEMDYTLKGLEYFMSVMDECNFKSYKVKKAESLTYTLIFDELLGKTNIDKVRTKYNNIYRVERGSDSKKAYDIEDDGDLFIEPFSYKKVTDYEKTKEVAVRSETGISIKDDPSPSIEVYEDLSLGRINPKEITLERDTYIFTGLSKSGTSVYCSSFMASSLSANEKILVIDMSSTQGTVAIAKSYFKDALIPDIKSVLLNSYVYEDYKCIIVPMDKVLSPSTKVSYLKFLLSLVPKINPTRIFVECDYNSSKEIISICKSRINKVMFTLQTLLNDINLVSYEVNNIAKNYSTVLLLNDTIEGLDVGNKLLATDVKQYFPDVPIVKPIRIPDFALDDTLNSVLLGG